MKSLSLSLSLAVLLSLSLQAKTIWSTSYYLNCQFEGEASGMDVATSLETDVTLSLAQVDGKMSLQYTLGPGQYRSTIQGREYHTEISSLPDTPDYNSPQYPDHLQWQLGQIKIMLPEAALDDEELAAKFTTTIIVNSLHNHYKITVSSTCSLVHSNQVLEYLKQKYHWQRDQMDTFGFSSDAGSILLLNVHSIEGGYSDLDDLPKNSALFSNGSGDGNHTAYIFKRTLNVLGLREYKQSLTYLGSVVSNGLSMIHEYDADPTFGTRRYRLLSGAWNVYNNGEGSIILEYMSGEL